MVKRSYIVSLIAPPFADAICSPNSWSNIDWNTSSALPPLKYFGPSYISADDRIDLSICPKKVCPTIEANASRVAESSCEVASLFRNDCSTLSADGPGVEIVLGIDDVKRPAVGKILIGSFLVASDFRLAR